MNKFYLYTIILVIFCVPAVQAQEISAWEKQGAVVSLYSGYSSRNFGWSIAGNYQGTDPNIYSELKWKDVRGPVAGAAVGFRVGKRWYGSAEAGATWTVSGQVSDADYAGDNRTERSYFGSFASDKGSGYWLRAGAGYCLINKKNLFLLLRAGYSYRFQNFRILQNTKDSSVIATGLNSAYRTRMQGAALGMNVSYQLTDKLGISLAPGYEWLRYTGRANWNLVSYFKHPLSFEQVANGFQLSGRVDVAYKLCKKVQAFIAFDYHHLKINGGEDVLYLSDGQILKSHFNGANGNSSTVLAGMTFHFPSCLRGSPQSAEHKPIDHKMF